MVKLAIFATLIAFSTVAIAEERVRPKELLDKPDGIVITEDNVSDLDFAVHGGYKCFTPEQYKEVANIIIDYRWFWYYAIKRDAIIGNYELQIGKYKTELALWQQMSQRQENSLNFTQTLVTEQNKMRANQSRGQKITLYTAIGVALLEAVVIGALAFK